MQAGRVQCLQAKQNSTGKTQSSCVGDQEEASYQTQAVCEIMCEASAHSFIQLVFISSVVKAKQLGEVLVQHEVMSVEAKF